MSWLVPLGVLVLVLGGSALVVWGFMWLSEWLDFPVFPVVVLVGACALVVIAFHITIREKCDREQLKGWICK